MSRKMLLLALLGAFVGCADTPAAVEPAERTQVVLEDVKEAERAAELSRAELEKENAALKRENRRLRRELIRQREGEPQIDLSKVSERKGVAGEETNGKATDDGGYWLATEKMRRHNSKCRYYKMGRGRPCQKDEGTPCKRCGG